MEWFAYLSLVFTHLASDWFLQPASWAQAKRKHFLPLLWHSIQYSALFVLAFFILKINFLWLLLVFCSHLAIDNYKAVEWWNKKIKRLENAPEWFETAQDQILHLAILIPIALWP